MSIGLIFFGRMRPLDWNLEDWDGKQQYQVSKARATKDCGPFERDEQWQRRTEGETREGRALPSSMATSWLAGSPGAVRCVGVCVFRSECAKVSSYLIGQVPFSLSLLKWYYCARCCRFCWPSKLERGENFLRPTIATGTWFVAFQYYHPK